ncbi:MAG: DUF4256 domain-containing protein [Chloroflexota bacterium]
MAAKGKGKPIPKVEINLNPTAEQRAELLQTIQSRFEQNSHLREGVAWREVLMRLQAQPEKIASLYAMETTGGEPNIVIFEQDSDNFFFIDCAAQSPTGRRSICYDSKGEAARIKKGIHPGGNAEDIAQSMGIDILDESQYRQLQALGEFDTKTESWLKTPSKIRALGGAIFGDRRYDTVFVSHNSAPSFYSSRGFRGLLRI